MPQIFHLNCLKIVSPFKDNVCGHCVLVQEADRLVLIDTGIGLLDTNHPAERIGQSLIDLVGYRFDKALTAVEQLKKMGFDPSQVTDCIITHFDNDHIGGLADFPNATVHVSQEELDNFNAGNPRYLTVPLQHQPAITPYGPSLQQWFGLEARKIILPLQTEILLIPLPGHTLGHCGVAFLHNNNWTFYIGDAYYLRAELSDASHPVHELARMRADDDILRLDSLDKIRRLHQLHPEINLFGYHDIDEFYKSSK